MNPTSSTISPISEIESLLTRARAGDQEAWNQLVARCSPKLMRVVRRRLNAPLRTLYDSMDVTNEVFASLAFKFEKFDFDSLEKLMSFLANSAEQKIIDEYRRRRTRKRNLELERPLDAEIGDGAFEPHASDPTPSQVAVADELLQRIRRDASEEDRRIVELKLAGYSNEDVSRAVGVSVRQVQRILQCLARGISKSPN